MINIKTNSKDIVPGDIFIAIKGEKYDGHDFVIDAKKRGAKCAIVEHQTNSGILEIEVENTAKWLKDYLVNYFADNINKMNLIGITGTNGKTTSAYLTYQILNKLGSKTAYIGTIGWMMPDFPLKPLNNTTPSIRDLYDILLKVQEMGAQNVVMEVSSHALDQERVAGLKFKCGAFTNLTQDHLDYHKTMAEYFAAKKKIINYLDGPLIVNTDDQYGRRLDEEYDKTLTYGYVARDFKILDIVYQSNGMIIKFLKNCQVYEVYTSLKAKFNVYNYLTALGITYSLGYSIDDIIGVTPEIVAPKGRCERIDIKGGEVIIDYAHTPDAVAKIINAFAENKKGKIITVLGCGGDRDKKKRSIMGGIATEFSDYVIFTSDNPRSEDPKLIIDDMIRWISKDNYEVILDRRKAIHKALDMIRPDDTVLLLGKGHEDYQIIGKEKYHFDDKEEVESYKLTLKKPIK